MPVPSAPQRFTSSPFRRATPAWRKGLQSVERGAWFPKAPTGTLTGGRSTSRSLLASAGFGLLMACTVVAAKAKPLLGKA
jgi:hypothetical protein